MDTGSGLGATASGRLFGSDGKFREAFAKAQQVTKQSDEARKHEAFIDKPIRTPNAPIRRRQKNRELGHDDDDLDHGHEHRQTKSISRLRKQSPAEPDVNHPPKIPKNIGADGFAVRQRVSRGENIFDNQRPCREDEQKCAKNLCTAR